MNKRTLFFYYGPHPFHKALAETVGAEFYGLNTIGKSYLEKIFIFLKRLLFFPKNYDIYFCEGTYLIPTFLKYIGLLSKDKKIIDLKADSLLYYLKIGQGNKLKNLISKKFLRYVDLFVCVGKMTDEFLKSFYPEAKSFIVYPFILEGRYERLISIPLKRRFDHNILFIGNGPDWYYKGLDLLVESFKEIKNYYDDAHLYILGNWSNEVVSKYSTEGISFVGYASPEDYVEKCSLYIHLGRGDTFPVSSLEAMLGGLPTIVSEFTGTKEVVSEVNKDFVLPLDKDKIVKRVIEYFELSDEDKYALSLKFRESAKRFRKDIVLEDFEKKWKENVL